jgi:hypothetical protein
MLQAIHDESSASRASSPYWIWISAGRETGSALVALWIDTGMRRFECELFAETPGYPGDEVWDGQLS